MGAKVLNRLTNQQMFKLASYIKENAGHFTSLTFKKALEETQKAMTFKVTESNMYNSIAMAGIGIAFVSPHPSIAAKQTEIAALREQVRVLAGSLNNFRAEAGYPLYPTVEQIATGEYTRS